MAALSLYSPRIQIAAQISTIRFDQTLICGIDKTARRLDVDE
jgi:hypothetical protein